MGDHPTTKVAYLVSEYPAVSHVFIEREIAALRQLGVVVATHSVRRGQGVETEGADAGTLDIQGTSISRVARAHLKAIRINPMGYARSLRSALRLGYPSPRARLWQMFYFIEAGVLWSRLVDQEISHIHVHFANNGADIARIAVRLGSELASLGNVWTWSLTMHGPAEFDRVYELDLPAKFADASFVSCISYYCRAQVMRLTDPGDWDKLHVVRMTPGTQLIERGEQVAAQRTSYQSSARINLLFVGRLVPAKGPTLLLDAFSILCQKHPELDLSLTIVGGGALLDKLMNRVLELGLTNVRLTGPQPPSEIHQMLESTDIFVLPSFAEGVPVVLMEAMAMSIPVVSSNITGIPELIQDPISGMLLTPGRLDQLVAALGKLIESKDLRQAIGAEGRVAVRTEYLPSINAEKLLVLFRSVLERNSL